MKNPYLIGSTVYLRPLEREDASTLVPWFNDPEVTRTLLRYLPMNLHAEEQFIERIYQDDKQIVLGIVRRDDDRLIGTTGLHQIRHKDRNTGFGIVIGDKESWDKGYGSEATALLVRYAFETLNLNRVWLHVFEENARAVRTYEKAGFRREGVLRQDHYHGGRYGNTVVMGLLREEWEVGRQRGPI
jgi:RimJ/RimL family protein N-acetyltransferase